MAPLSQKELVYNALLVSAARLREQQKLAVEFGTTAVQALTLQAVIQQACKVASIGLKSRYVKVLQYRPETDSLLLIAGVGWDDSDVGSATFAANDTSPAGYAYATGQSVLSNRLGSEHRFRTPALLKKYGIKRAINVPIRGVSKFFGVLEADSAEDDDFIETDILFLEALANVLALARERQMAERYPDDSGYFSTNFLNASNDCIHVLSLDGRIQFCNNQGLLQMEVTDSLELKGLRYLDLWPEQEQEKVQDALAKASQGGSSRFEGLCPTRKKAPRWWDVSITPVCDDNGQVRRIASALRDITERHGIEQTLDALVSQQEAQITDTSLMMKEVHHRVRNSLQLVHALLSLQASVAGDKIVASQLQAAAARVMTVGAVHRRLYEDSGSKETNAMAYLEGLITDMSGLATDRKIFLQAPPVIIPASRLAPLGLVTAELVSNALRYGRGRIDVALEDTQDSLRLTVDDEGSGFPETFPTPQGTGLGMRLIKTYCRGGADAITVDRSVPFSRIAVVFRKA